MSNFFAILTNAGEAKLANALALGTTIKLTQMGVGDGNGAAVTPTPTMTTLVKERRRAAVNTLFVDPLSASQIVAEQVIPEDVGDWWIREIGLYDDAGTLIAVANCPDTYKPLLTSGAGRTQVIRMVLIVSDTTAVELKIDPSVVLATRKYVDDVMTGHKTSRDHPDASETAKGFARFATAAEADPATEAAASASLAASIARVFTVLRSAVANASETLRGTLRIATQAETDSVSLNNVAVSPAKLANHYRRGNIVGTVSQQGGIPTGAIIERGSNANGSYTKFADGTMIVRGSKASPSDVAANASDTVQAQFPVVFSTVDIYVVATYNGSQPVGVASVGAVFVDKFEIGRKNFLTSPNSMSVMYTAIGSWF